MKSKQEEPKNVLVTGAAGFVGHNLVRELINQGHQVLGLDNYSSGKKDNHIPGARYIDVDTEWNCIECLDLVDFNPDVVFHLGEYSRIATSFDDIKTVWLSNSLGTFYTIDFCRKQNIKLIYAGSSTKFAKEGTNHSPYSFTKAQNTELIKNYNKWYGLDYAICYFYNVFGPGYDSSPVPGYESVVSVFEKQWRAGKPLTICGSGKQTRAFTYVNDIVNGLISAWHYPHPEEFQLNNPKEYSILDIAKMFTNDITFLPARPGDRDSSISTNDNSRELLNWEATMDVKDWINELKHEIRYTI